MKVGVLGGSFDPVHKGHISLARAALYQLRLDRVYFVLSPRSPFKSRQKKISSHHRFKMLTLALSNEKLLLPADWELKRRGPSYTVATLQRYKRKYPGHQIYLILGSDAFRGFSKWKDPEKILEICRLVVGKRKGIKMPPVQEFKKWDVARLKGVFPLISSTQIRTLVKNEDLRLTSLLPRKVMTYIQKNKLYV